MTDETVIRADPQLRKIALLGLLGAVVVGAVTIGVVVPWLVRSLEVAVATGTVSNRAVCIGYLAFLAAIGVGVVAIGVAMVRTGRRVVAEGRVPLRGERVLRDTRVLAGPTAVRIGRGQQAIGALLVLAAIALFGLTAYALWVLL